ncbi:unnamed protein product [Microthlaspi erraticum]|uniref:Cytochrome P450 n=1 Tax=Microthlaspi erraticum TaxID=1685480 RepID=A0A6D2J0W8_9BRAS|nr:unnamed protein product [Microthlaspi erraticum]
MSIGLFEISIAFLCFLVFYFFLTRKPFGYFLTKKYLESSPWNWPVLGMLPGGLLRLYNLSSMEILENSNLNFQFKGPWFAGMDMLVTVDPSNIHHIMSSNFSNYTKSRDFQEIFEAFGDSIINTNSELWKNLRKASQTMLNHQGFQRLSMSITRSKLNDGLLPFLSHFAEEGTVVDLQDVFQRFSFDATFALITGSDPRSLSIEMPEVEFIKALDVV